MKVDIDEMVSVSKIADIFKKSHPNISNQVIPIIKNNKVSYILTTRNLSCSEIDAGLFHQAYENRFTLKDIRRNFKKVTQYADAHTYAIIEERINSSLSKLYYEQKEKAHFSYFLFNIEGYDKYFREDEQIEMRKMASDFE